MTRYIVMTRTAKMPASVKARYLRVGVVETDLPDGEPKMLSERARGVIRVVKTWESCHAGRTASPKTQYGRCLAEAQALAASLSV